MMQRCVIVGAGIAGIMAAHRLKTAGIGTTLLDKGRRPGGRMATRDMGGGRIDYGAQFITVRDPAFNHLTTRWAAAGILTEWSRGFAGPDGTVQKDGHPRFRGVSGMNAIPAHVAQGLDVRSQEEVEALSLRGQGWEVLTRSETRYLADALILTPPVPQSLRLLERGDVSLSEDLSEILRAITYDPCLAVLAVLEGPSRLPAPGGVQLAGKPIAWIADNRIKGISPRASTLTIHGGPSFSRSHLDSDPKKTLEHLLDAASEWCAAAIQEARLHRWRYSLPASTHSERCLMASEPAPLLFAGDAFGGPRVEGAALSGLAAADRLLEVWAS
jgi:predicted NAD/FAD-dependent oxidoreductase